MTLMVDRRETTLFPLLPSGSYQKVDLGRYGDAAWYAEGPDPARPPYCGMERKRLSDALGCRDDGRLIDQLRFMVERYDIIYILIEDEYRPNPRSGVLEKKLVSKNRRSARWV